MVWGQFVRHPTLILRPYGARGRRNRISKRRHWCYPGSFLPAMEEPMSRTVFGLAGLAAVLFAAPAVAHHAFAMFDSSKLLYMTGTVKQFDFVNPHAWLHVIIANDKGEISTWAFEGGSPSQLVSLGWSKEHPAVGDKIEVGFYRLKDGSRGGQLMSVKFPNGQLVCSNRGCGDG